MESDRLKWNRKYTEADRNDTPSDIIVRFAPFAPAGRALDIAAGTGRNALYLAGKGFVVDAVDISDVGLHSLSGRHGNIRPVCADFDHYDITAQTYDLIVNINFLQRRLFPLILEGLKPGGMLIFETFVEGAAPADGRPEKRDYLLRPNELMRAFLPLHLIYYRERPNIPPDKASHVASLVGYKK